MGGDHRSRLLGHRTRVVELVAKQPDLTLQEIRGALATGHGISVGLTSLWRFLKAQNLTLLTRIKFGLFGPFSLCQSKTPPPKPPALPAKPADLLSLPMKPNMFQNPGQQGAKAGMTRRYLIFCVFLFWSGCQAGSNSRSLLGIRS
jgi:hypothetical protein